MTTTAPDSGGRTWRDLPEHPPVGDPHRSTPLAAPPLPPTPSDDAGSGPSPGQRRAAIIACVAVIAVAVVAGLLFFLTDDDDPSTAEGAIATADAPASESLDPDVADPGAADPEGPAGLEDLFPDGSIPDGLIPEGLLPDGFDLDDFNIEEFNIENFSFEDLPIDDLLGFFFDGERDPFSGQLTIPDGLTADDLLERLPNGLIESFGVDEGDLRARIEEFLESNR